ncbi:EamA family transporter RarD [Zhihengliuella flava]|uniref:Chloramphenicol-sensitive protein RarD n=1 Tax=Zhihengliuella flava TaxID=1285193 RepID=A0A931GFE7_9MICC|nr:chloramphenicol-sensitive protein RarD [Zhihengliuella flava]
MSSSMQSAPHERTQGLWYGVTAYGLWGVLPLYFALVAAAGAVEILAHRIVWSLVVCLLLVTLLKQWRVLGALVRRPRALAWLAAASLLIGVNWLTFAFAVLSGHALEASLGYYINPLLSIALGVLILGEKLSRLQFAAIGAAIAAVLIMAIAYGSVPWVSLLLATTFALYGYAKNRVGRGTTAVASLTVETAVLVVPALITLAVLGSTGQATAFSLGPGHFWLLLGLGVITATPLLFFGAAATRLPLSVVGSLQYIAPTAQFLIALLVFHEPMPPERWAGFALVWVAIGILTVDLFRRRPRSRT